MWIVEVIPIKRGFPKESLTYFSGEAVTDGTVVSVPIRSKLVDAVVISCKDARTEKAAIKSGAFSLKKIAKVRKGSPIPEYIFETAGLCARYYRQTRGHMLDLLVPDYCYYETLGDPKPRAKTDEEAQPERLLFQAPLEERISYYRTHAREAFARKESLMIVAPTIADCEIFFQALSRGIADFVVVLNSDMPKKKFADVLKRLGTEPHPLVIISTPSYATLLRPDVTTIVLEHESSTAYTTPSTPSFDYRVLIEILARTAGKKFILGDSLLRVETLGRHELKEFGAAMPITFRALTPIEVAVIAHSIPETIAPRARNEQIEALSLEVRARIEKCIASGERIFLFALRTGLATVTRCRDCGTALLCEYCEAALVLYASGTSRVFICNKCKRHRPSEGKCPRCNSWNLSAQGLGTAFVEEEVKRLYPSVPVFRIDREAAPTRADARKIAAQFTETKGAVLIGTEMALFYVTERVDESVIVSFDTLFNIPSYRTNERIIALMLAIAERTKHKLFVQTRRPEEPVIALIQSNNYSAWYRAELAERYDYDYPPATTILKITWHGREKDRAPARDYLTEMLAAFSPDVFDSILVINGKKESAVNAILRPKREDWSLFALMNGKGLSEHLREALAKLPENTIFSVNPDNLL